LPYGGAKGGVNVDLATISKRELEALSRRYMQEMIPFVGPHTDVMAPDMGTNEQVMAWFMDTYSMYQGRTVTEIVTGKPVSSGGTLGRREATGRGVAHLAKRVMKELAINLNNATAVIQGFGNVGSYAALELHRFGLKVIAVSDHTGALHDKAGSIFRLMRHAGEHGSIAGFSNQLQFDPAQILTLPCDVLVPAAMERVIDAQTSRKPEMPRAGRRRQRPDHAGRRSGAGKTPGRNVPDSRHPLQFRRRRGQLFRMGAGPAAAVLGRRRGDAARIPDPRSRLRPDGDAREGRQDSPSHRRDGDRRGEGPRRQEHAGAVPVITGLDHVVVGPRYRAGTRPTRRCLRARRRGSSAGDGAERVLFTLDNMTLELMAPKATARPRTGFARCLPSRARGWRASAFAPATSRKCIAGSIG
jgi:hypothetical protein